jgi:hypothetical protein
MDTLSVLDWLSKHSRVHKHILVDALHEYPSDSALALGRLKSRSSIPEFQRVVDKLSITVYQSTLAEAFSDLATEREHLMRMRETSQVNTIEKKRALMSPFAMSTAMAVVLLYIIGPIGIVGLAELQTTFANLPI